MKMEATVQLSRTGFIGHTTCQASPDQLSRQEKGKSSALCCARHGNHGLSRRSAGRISAGNVLSESRAHHQKLVLRTVKAGVFQDLVSHKFLSRCPSNQRERTLKGNRSNQGAQACVENSPHNVRPTEGESIGSDSAQSGEPPVDSGDTSRSNENGNGAAPESQEEKNHRGNINWRRRALQAVRGDEVPITAPPPDFISDRPQRPFRIFLVRHGESEGNVDESMYTRIPDSKIALTERGKRQAEEAGRQIREIIQAGQDGDDDNWMVYFYVSPYLRTLQTLRGIGAAFERRRIAGVREEPRLREQDFGNFQDREKMRVEKTIRLRFGRFFYRFPDGESAADVYDRVTGFRETLRTDIDVGRFQKEASRRTNMNLILVSHGLTLRVFLMRWYKWTVDQFQQLHNLSNAGFLVMELGPGGRYSLTAHHTHEELATFGLTPDMIADQEWQVMARPGDLNSEWPTSGPSFFDYFENLQDGNALKYPDRSAQFDKIMHDLNCPPTEEELRRIEQFPT